MSPTCPGKYASRAGKMTSSSCFEWMPWAKDTDLQAAAKSFRVAASATPGLAAAASFSSCGIASRNASTKKKEQ